MRINARRLNCMQFNGGRDDGPDHDGRYCLCGRHYSNDYRYPSDYQIAAIDIGDCGVHNSENQTKQLALNGSKRLAARCNKPLAAQHNIALAGNRNHPH